LSRSSLFVASLRPEQEEDSTMTGQAPLYFTFRALTTSHACSSLYEDLKPETR
jgi:hypothetical protein